MASTTKIMTALLVLEQANLNDVVTVFPAALVGEASMGLVAGESLTVEDLLWGLLLRSGNDAAAALAEHVAGSQQAFVDLMNQRAAELGLTSTHFANPHGLDAPDHYSSAEDLWRLAELAMANPAFRTMVATQSHEAAGRQLFNINELLGLYPGADGIKTGTSDAAGQCLVGSASQDGFRTVGGGAGQPGSLQRRCNPVRFRQGAEYRRGPAPCPRRADILGARGLTASRCVSRRQSVRGSSCLPGSGRWCAASSYLAARFPWPVNLSARFAGIWAINCWPPRRR